MSKRPTVLIVDDEPVNVKLLHALLAPQDYDIKTACSGEETLAHTAAADHGIDLILLDIMMPGMDGFEVTRRLRDQAHTRLIPIVMVTALRETEDRVKGIEAGGDDFISKPFNQHEVLARVRALLKISYYRSLLDHAQRLAYVVERVQDGIVVLDKHLAVTTLNPPAAAWLMLDPANPPTDFLHALAGRFTIQYAGDLRADLQRQPVACDLERPETETAKPLIVAMRSTIATEPTGEISSLVLTFQDVTSQRREEFLKQDFLSLISHKLHTPMTVIDLHASILCDGSLGPLLPQQQEALDTITQHTDELAALIEKLLVFTTVHRQILQPETKPVLLREFLTKTCEPLLKRAKKPVDLQLDCPDASVGTTVNKTYLDLIIKNLLDNAIKFNDKPQAHIMLAAKRHNGKVQITVTDNGPGIAPEERERVFDAFYQVEKWATGNVEGAGLGLALVKRLVTAYGGSLELDSSLNLGTTLRLTLPG